MKAPARVLDYLEKHPKVLLTAGGAAAVIAIADRKAPIPDLAAFRIDFARWLKGLTRRDQRVIAAFVSGERTWTVAERFGVSEARVSQLRRKYEREWRVFQGEAA